MGCGLIKAWMDPYTDSAKCRVRMHFLVNLLIKKAWFFLGVLTAVAIQAQRLPLPPRVRTAALALGKQIPLPKVTSLLRRIY